jgi:AcrR family transcriptional regulator
MAGDAAAGPQKAPTRRRVRKNPEARRADIVARARDVFATVGYAESGLAEIAQAAQVSKGLLYHYFPDGRAGLFVAVTRQELADFQERLRQAARLPFSQRKRMEHLLAVLFGFFDEKPEALRLMFLEPSASRDKRIEAAAVATRVQISAELAGVMSNSGLPADDLVAASAGILGFAIANVELCAAGQLDPETAWRVTCDYATSRLS